MGFWLAVRIVSLLLGCVTAETGVMGAGSRTYGEVPCEARPWASLFGPAKRLNSLQIPA